MSPAATAHMAGLFLELLQGTRGARGAESTPGSR